MKSNSIQLFSAPKHRRCRGKTILEIEDGCIEEKQEQVVSTNFLQTQKNQLFGSPDHLVENAILFQSFASTAENTTFILMRSY